MWRAFKAPAFYAEAVVVVVHTGVFLYSARQQRAKRERMLYI